MQESTPRRFLWLFACLATVGLISDQVSKYVVFAKLYPADTEWETRVTVIPGCFDLRTGYYPNRHVQEGPFAFLRTISGERVPHVNRGALFGLGNGDAETGGMNNFFAVVSILAACFIIAWVFRPTIAQDRWLCLALGLILAGTLGNLYDRLVFSGVRDFVHWYWGEHIWPDFNIADCCLVVGASTLFLHSIFSKENASDGAGESVAGQVTPPLQTPSL